jgi:DNA-binding CsgD family transcriptional regulator
MPKNISFSAITRTMLDKWLLTEPDNPAPADAVFSTILPQMSVKMRLTLFTIYGSDPKNWHMKALRHSGFVSRILNINSIFADNYLRDFKDQRYLEDAVIPRLVQVVQSQQPSMELVKTRLFGVNVGYDRVLIPQKNSNGPEWILSASYGQFLLSEPQFSERLDVTDEGIVQLLIEGSTAKEIAAELNVSHRTVEHRIDRLKERYGARNTVHLVAMLVTAQAEKMANR